jgi:hypothetical protein
MSKTFSSYYLPILSTNIDTWEVCVIYEKLFKKSSFLELLPQFYMAIVSFALLKLASSI